MLVAKATCGTSGTNITPVVVVVCDVEVSRVNIAERV